MQRRKFSREFKLEAVKLIKERGVAVAQAARDLDVHENVLRKWAKDFVADPQQAFPGQGQMKPEQLEIERLRREVAKLKAERDILKKGRGLLREGLDMKFGFVAKHRGIWPTAWLCEALGVSRSGFYAWLTRSPSQRAKDDEAIGAKVRASFVASDRTYGARRVWHDVLADGVSCGLHRIERLMHGQALRARPRRRGLPPDTGERVSVGIASNLLDRQFQASAPNQKWVADFTYVWTAEGWLYVAAVVDLFSRRVVGWSMNASMMAQLVTDALMMAIWRRGKPDALLHHSDRGSQYTSAPFQRLMADNGVICSMSRSGNVWDNAAMESFFSSLKTERTARKVYRTRDQAKADVFDYIERFYNPRRRHSTLGYLSPMEFENQANLA
ncbi:IS3 family transposase [Phreatobacter stygius]|uniref:IS3 family transposase n=1 Tax=Phreatobacter stygius TaxID=1940610 RepID=A0A4D7B2S9_9HYPH|nr:IS3 family transposase [Phreatobacter stygius]QCI65138.1 IS3 family transposase [Phreatobacter stygius]QCI67844.1 IS3 family transposase [Phreatobacter stygius]